MNIIGWWSRGLRTVQGARFAVRPRLLARFLIAVGLMAGAGLGALLTLKGSGADVRSNPTIEGTWELTALSGEPIRAESSAGVIWQRVSFRGGKVRGETRVQSSPTPGMIKLPFPDESVDRVISGSGDSGLRVLWSGTYEIDGHRQVTLHVGKAIYFAKFTWRTENQAIEFNQDVILVVPGAAAYRRAIASPEKPAQDELELFPGSVR